MINLLADNSLPYLEDYYGHCFHITRFASARELMTQIKHQDILLCRSTVHLSAEMLRGSRLRCVATASSGTDHLDLAYLQSQHITVLDAKGVNARAVTDYVLACFAYLHTQLAWRGRRIGIIGVGAVGSKVAARLRALGYAVCPYDPPQSLRDHQFVTADWDELLTCDALCIHANLHDGPDYPSRHLLDARRLSLLKPHTVIINAARGDIVAEAALLACQQPLLYCTDVYATEPKLAPEVVAYATLCTPHIAGHSSEAHQGIAGLMSQKIHQFFGLNQYLPALPTLAPLSIASKSDWPSTVLSLYNPRGETQALKEATDLPKTFIALRQAHYRHDFNRYHVPVKAHALRHALGL